MLYYGILGLNIAVCVLLVIVVLLQRSEGGALGGGGSPTGLVTTRGAGDLLTRTTWILFALFLTLSLALTLIGGQERSSQAIIDRLKLQSVNPETLASRAAPANAVVGAPAPATPASSDNAASKPSRIPGAAPAPVFSAPAPVITLPPLPGDTKPAKP